MQKVERSLLLHALSPVGTEKAINRLAGWVADDNLDYSRAETTVNENVYVDFDPTDKRYDDIYLRLAVEFDPYSNDWKRHRLTEQGLDHLVQIMGGVYGGRDGLHSRAVLDFLCFFADEMSDRHIEVELIPSTITQSMYLLDGKGTRCCVPDAIGVLNDLVPSMVQSLGTLRSPYRYHNQSPFPAFGNSAFLQFEIQLSNYDRLVGKLQKNLSLNAEETTRYHIYPIFVIKEEESRSGFPAFESVLETLTAVLPENYRRDRLKFFNLISFSTYNMKDVMTLDWPQRLQELHVDSYKIHRYGER